MHHQNPALKINAHFYKAFQARLIQSTNNHGSSVKSFKKEIEEKIIKAIHDEELDVRKLSGMMNYSRAQLYRKVKKAFGLSPSELILYHKMVSAKSLLKSTDNTVSEIAFSLGYKSVAHFSRSYKAYFGITPGSTKK
jgi:AraC-like DNA-binding protein